MRAVVVNRPGGLDALTVADRPEPVPGDGEVLVKIAFAGCNWADTQVRGGLYPHQTDYPVVPGFEVSGTIAKLGPGVTGLAVGARVLTFPDFGGYAEYCVAPAAMVTPLPDAMALDIAAAFPIQALTAHHMLHTVHKIRPGDTVLVHAAGGGVGLAVTQLGVLAGARLIGTVGTRGKEVKPLAYGAARVINLGEEDFVAAVMAETDQAGVDLAIDSLGAGTLDRTFDAIRLMGHVINIGEAEGMPYRNIRDRLVPRSGTFTRFHVGHVMADPELWRDGLDRVMQAILDGRLEVPIVDRIPLERVRDMHAALEARHVSGKLLLRIHD